VTTDAVEVNFDGLVGPTHNYAGLSHGNLASQQSKHRVSNPRAAALEGLAKMKLLADLGVPQAVLPPHERPDLDALRRLDFAGSDADVLLKAKRADPALLAACCSASPMWAANAATVSPGSDTADGRVHFTPANLVSQRHRSLEPETTARVLRAIFGDERHFAHHPPVDSSWGDEGAANHLRLAPRHGTPGVEVFVYGRSASESPPPGSFPRRQVKSASEEVARRHGLPQARVWFARQSDAAIERGAFHNDVVSVANESVLLFHEQAFAEPGRLLTWLAQQVPGFVPVEVSAAELSLEEAVKTYLFNSQLVTLPDRTMTLVAPAECAEHSRVCRVIDRLLAAGTPLHSVHYVNVRQSMCNGGGPACLRLRVVLTEPQRAVVTPGVFLTDDLYQALTAWVNRHYRERLSADDLADPALLGESRGALDELTRLLALPSIFPFQLGR
jgi:succinylarginine dihydrolase